MEAAFRTHVVASCGAPCRPPHLLLQAGTAQASTFSGRPVEARLAPGRDASGARPCLRLQATAAEQVWAAPDAGGAGPAAYRSHETDVVVIGSGIGGLCCAALLAKYGYRVTVCESHYLPGGAAHSFESQGYLFDAGPSFHAGLSPSPTGAISANPLKQVLDAVGEAVPCVTYDRWVVHGPEGSFPCICNAAEYEAIIARFGGPGALGQWRALDALLAPLQAGAASFPAAALRADAGVVLTAARFGPALLQTAFRVRELTGPFGDVVDQVVTDPWLRRFLDLECYVLSGMTARDTICAEMAFMFGERNGGGSTIDYPLGGSAAIVDALIRGIEKHGGRVLLRAHVEGVVMEGGRAAGVRLRPRKAGAAPEVIRARHAVVSNATGWDTQKLLPPGAAPPAFQAEAGATPMTNSFMHLHLGIDAAGLPPGLDCHHLIVNSWEGIEAPQNVIIASVPTVFDPSLAPPGKAVVHCYSAANEPYALWQGMRSGSPEYESLKEERSQCLWEALERFIPDIRQRAEVTMVGTPLTHERFLRRHRGTYGAAISARDGAFPGPKTPVPGLYRCGDSCAPGIGVPAAAASGMIAANTLMPVWSQISMMDAMGL